MPVYQRLYLDYKTLKLYLNFPRRNVNPSESLNAMVLNILSKHIAWESALWANTNYPTLQIILNHLNVAGKHKSSLDLGKNFIVTNPKVNQELVSLEMVAEAFFVLTE